MYFNDFRPSFAMWVQLQVCCWLFFFVVVLICFIFEKELYDHKQGGNTYKKSCVKENCTYYTSNSLFLQNKVFPLYFLASEVHVLIILDRSYFHPITSMNAHRVMT